MPVVPRPHTRAAPPPTSGLVNTDHDHDHDFSLSQQQQHHAQSIHDEHQLVQGCRRGFGRRQWQRRRRGGRRRCCCACQSPSAYERAQQKRPCPSPSPCKTKGVHRTGPSLRLPSPLSLSFTRSPFRFYYFLPPSSSPVSMPVPFSLSLFLSLFRSATPPICTGSRFRANSTRFQTRNPGARRLIGLFWRDLLYWLSVKIICELSASMPYTPSPSSLPSPQIQLCQRSSQQTLFTLTRTLTHTYTPFSNCAAARSNFFLPAAETSRQGGREGSDALVIVESPGFRR